LRDARLSSIWGSADTALAAHLEPPITANFPSPRAFPWGLPTRWGFRGTRPC